MALKNTSEALFNRNQILDSFEQAQNTGNKEERRRLMTFAIVGGGAESKSTVTLIKKHLRLREPALVQV